MSMISEQIKQLREYSKELESSCSPSESYMVKQAADTIKELSVKLQALQMDMSIQYRNDGWIPCEDRMPEEKPESQAKITLVAMGVRGIKLFNFSDEVLVTVHDITEDKLFVSTDSTENGKWRERFHQEYEHSYEVLAWQPKPVPYKGKESD